MRSRLENRIDAVSTEVSGLAVQVAVLTVRQKGLDDKFDEVSKKVDMLSHEITGIKDLLTEARGGWRALIFVGTIVGAIAGWVISRTDILSRMFH